MIRNGLLTLVLVVGVPAVGMAEGMTSTQDLLIDKLTQVQLGLAPADPARGGVLLRLGDLHAERARQLSMKEIGEGCAVCNAGKTDREKALRFYSEALLQVPSHATGKVHLQMGHIYELQGDTVKAQKSYKSMLDVSKSPIEKAEAYLSLGEMAFRRSDFKEARQYYEQVLATEGASSQGLAAYRKSWCAFRMGEMQTAIAGLTEVLKNPKLQSRMAVSRGAADMQFLEEVSRDMATIMAARGIQASDAETLYDLTPESFRLQQVTLLAREGLRLGQKQADLQVWDFVYQKQQDPKARLEAQVRIAQLNFDLKNHEMAGISFQRALGLWRGTDCTVQTTVQTCDEMQKGLRQFVVGWNRLETEKVSPGLLNAYREYLEVFSQDADMYVWGSQAAVKAGDFENAANWTSKTSNLIAAEYGAAKDAEKKSLAEKLEKNLLLGIEIAEKAKDEKLLIAAQDQYLAKSITKEKALDVEYQKVYALYKKEQYGPAAEALHAIATKETGSMAIRTQAAELSLDALTFLKDNVRLQQWSRDYGTRFVNKAADFRLVEQKSVLAQSAALAEAQPEAALAALAGFNAAAASVEDRKVYLKNKILLSEKINKIPEARVAVEDFLRLPNLTAEEREFGLGRQMWFAELELDFTTALKAAEQMKFTELSRDEKVLKLALYSELANKDPKAYYSEYLKESRDADKKALIAARIIKESKTPEKDLFAYKGYLAATPDLIARTALDIYAQNQDSKLLEKVLKEKHTRSDNFVMMERILLLADLQKLNEKVAGHSIDSKNQKALAASLKARVKLLSQLDGIANKAIALGDWSSQLLSLDVVAKENQRFYGEVLSLPMPEGLTPEQEQEYLMLLSQQVAPNQNTAQMASTKVKEFWALASAQEHYKKFAEQNRSWAVLLSPELESLVAVAPEEQKMSWTSLANEVKAMKPSETVKPSLAEIEKARMNLKLNPFAPAAIEEMLKLEERAQRQGMVEYLQSRLASISKTDTKERQ